MSGVTIYCLSCGTNHHLTAGQAEIVIHTLVAEWGTAAVDGADPIYEGDTGDSLTYDWCALDHLGWVQDGETYAEHIESMVESRRVAARPFAVADTPSTNQGAAQ